MQCFFFGCTQNENRNMSIRNKGELYNFGAPWGKAFLDNNQIDISSSEKAVEQLTSTYEELINIANKFQRYPVIGGRVQSLIIKPDGTADTSKLNAEAII